MTKIFHLIYKHTVSRLLVILFGEGCIFEPSCSEYSKQALGKYGLLQGIKLSVFRVAKCNPFYSGDLFDPLK